jgi:hypothetical protein
MPENGAYENRHVHRWRLSSECPGCGNRHPWDEAWVWGLLSIRCPVSPTGYWYFDVQKAEVS